MKKTLVGRYRLGMRIIRLYIEHRDGGSVIVFPKDKGQPNVTVGIKTSYADALGTLLHEIYEVSLLDLNTRYAPAPSWGEESSDYVFIASHNQLSEAHQRVANFLNELGNDFKMAYELSQAKPKKKKK